MAIYELTKKFPEEEMYSLSDQIRRSSRSVSGNLAEAWRKRRYEKAFISKLNDAEGEAAETQTWLEYALACNYISENIFTSLNDTYNQIIGMIVTMTNNPKNWTI